jgi:hypothetical protein
MPAGSLDAIGVIGNIHNTLILQTVLSSGRFPPLWTMVSFAILLTVSKSNHSKEKGGECESTSKAATGDGKTRIGPIYPPRMKSMSSTRPVLMQQALIVFSRICNILTQRT